MAIEDVASLEEELLAVYRVVTQAMGPDFMGQMDLVDDEMPLHEIVRRALAHLKEE